MVLENRVSVIALQRLLGVMHRVAAVIADIDKPSPVVYSLRHLPHDGLGLERPFILRYHLRLLSCHITVGVPSLQIPSYFAVVGRSLPLVFESVKLLKLADLSWNLSWVLLGAQPRHRRYRFARLELVLEIDGPLTRLVRVGYQRSVRYPIAGDLSLLAQEVSPLNLGVDILTTFEAA